MIDPTEQLLNRVLDDWAECITGCCHASGEDCPHYAEAERLAEADRWAERDAVCFLCQRKKLTMKYGLEKQDD